ncbi:TPR repeat protein [Candidatus Koribacter versatilis Ellin345]|uniref:TPR repeat protein n=1 Tax=Koribacter versatilis (strain Ellin345) TaxID=204669 RepID=Q1IN61_KORVE|nr:tetratricopeptide repeat protein [Candidatus Koribacter versatilis]ABF41689.1 TPR repeat protein [Candidatus Koribacter versatilis Ellin345]
MKEPSAPAPADLRNNPDYVRVYDQLGREVYVEKAKWRTEILPGNLKANWDAPDALYSMIVGALQDGFFEDVQQAAEHLCQIDSSPDRATTVYAIVLMKTDHLDEAERVLTSYLQQHGEDATILTNLAKVYSARSQLDKAEATLWHALELDPNLDNGFAWYTAIYRDRGGEAAGLDAMRRIAALPGSWRAQLSLARAALDANDFNAAMAQYGDAFSRLSASPTTQMLMLVSGDLGQHGHPEIALALTAPHFHPEEHGLAVGNNLIKANLDLGNSAEARRILDALYALQRPDWKDTLDFWDTAITKAGLEKRAVAEGEPLESIALVTQGPVWLKPDSLAVPLFALPPGLLKVAIIGSTAEFSDAPSQVELQITDAPGRLSRALPLFLAEQLAFHSGVSVETLTPWVNRNPGGFMLSGQPWDVEDAIGYAEMSSKPDYIIICHLKLQESPELAELRIVRTADQQVIGTLDQRFAMQALQDGLPQLASKLIDKLSELTKVSPRSSPLYRLVSGSNFPDYLLRLEQLLAVRTASEQNAGPEFLYGPREILQGNIELCAANPQNVATRLLLAQTSISMKSVHPDVVREFKDKLLLLQQQHPLPTKAQAVIQGLFSEAFS